MYICQKLIAYLVTARSTFFTYMKYVYTYMYMFVQEKLGVTSCPVILCEYICDCNHHLTSTDVQCYTSTLCTYIYACNKIISGVLYSFLYC